MTGVLRGQGKLGRTDTHRGRRLREPEEPPSRTPCDDRGRDWTDTAASQGKPRTDGHDQKARKDFRWSMALPTA